MIIGNTFPMTLVPQGANVIIQHSSLAELQAAKEADDARGMPLASFWGHANTMASANKLLGFDVTPATERPALKAGPRNWTLPLPEGEASDTTIWVVSPIYTAGFRPAIGIEVTPEQIKGWQVLKVSIV